MPTDDKEKEKDDDVKKPVDSAESELKKLAQEKSEDKQSSNSESSESEVNAKLDFISFFKKKQKLKRQIIPYSIALLALGFLIYWWKLIVSIILWFIIIPCVLVASFCGYSAIREKDKGDKMFLMSVSGISLGVGLIALLLMPSSDDFDLKKETIDKLIAEAVEENSTTWHQINGTKLLGGEPFNGWIKENIWGKASVKCIVQFENGIRNGYAISFYENGEIRSQGKFIEQDEISLKNISKTKKMFLDLIDAINAYKEHYKYSPPFLLENDEGVPTLLNEDNSLNLFIAALHGMKWNRRSKSWEELDGDLLTMANRKKIKFYSFTEDNFGDEGFLKDAWGGSNIHVLVDQDLDGEITLSDRFWHTIPLPHDYDVEFVIGIDGRDVNNIQDKVAFYTLGEENIGNPNIFSWDLDYRMNPKSVKDGYWQGWHDNGQKKYKGEWDEGLEEGSWTYWDRKGRKSEEGEYVKGLKEGSWTTWNYKGRKSEEGEYVKGLKEGTWTGWHDNGQKLMEGEYVKDSKEGAWTFWNDDGSIERKYDYTKDELVYPKKEKPHEKSQNEGPVEKSRYTWNKKSVETLGVETVEEFGKIIDFLYRSWRVTGGEGEVNIPRSGFVSAKKLVGTKFIFEQRGIVTESKYVMFNIMESFRIHKIIESPKDAPSNYILDVSIGGHGNEILTLFDRKIQLSWRKALLYLR
jgi:antitoxin component YwqK of YwqJK toxin-antitoxin module